MWIAYDRISPIGDWRGDAQAAQIAVATLNAQGGKYEIKDLILQFGQQDKTEEISELEAWMENL